MEDWTERFLRYREISRLVWNLGFLPDLEPYDYLAFAHWRDVLARLFEGIVVAPLGLPLSKSPVGQPGGPQFQVKVRAGRLNVLIANLKYDGPGRAWTEVTLDFSSPEYDLRYLSYFDWDQTAPMDCRFVNAQIVRLDSDPQYVGKELLVDSMDCCGFFYLEEE